MVSLYSLSIKGQWICSSHILILFCGSVKHGILIGLFHKASFLGTYAEKHNFQTVLTRTWEDKKKPYFKADVFNLWVVTPPPPQRQMTLHGDQLRPVEKTQIVTIWFKAVTELWWWSSNKMILWLGVATWGTVFKGYSIRNVEKHCFKGREIINACWLYQTSFENGQIALQMTKTVTCPFWRSSQHMRLNDWKQEIVGIPL